MMSKRLTYDEQKAAEAAFRGLPPDSKWSSSARAIYDGIIKVTQGRDVAEPLVEEVTV
ncbi:hypothetical protein [Candidatus Nitrospira bockiana]